MFPFSGSGNLIDISGDLQAIRSEPEYVNDSVIKQQTALTDSSHQAKDPFDMSKCS